MKTPAKTFEDLVVWQKPHRIVLADYLLTQGHAKGVSPICHVFLVFYG
jgi:hypothetical protein